MTTYGLTGGALCALLFAFLVLTIRAWMRRETDSALVYSVCLLLTMVGAILTHALMETQ